jgi:adenylate kinase
MRVTLIGPPGVGKGTQAVKMAAELGCLHVSSGDLLREAISNETEEGVEAKKFVDRGELVPDELIIRMIGKLLKEKGSDGFILDGFPRTVTQAESLDRYLEDCGTPLDFALELYLDDEVIVQRLSGRRIAPGSGRIYHVIFNPPKLEGKCDETGEPLCTRPDDEPDTIRKRLEVYHEKTEPVLDYYRNRGTLRRVSAHGTPDEVFHKIREILNF